MGKALHDLVEHYVEIVIASRFPLRPCWAATCPSKVAFVGERAMNSVSFNVSGDEVLNDRRRSCQCACGRSSGGAGSTKLVFCMALEV